MNLLAYHGARFDDSPLERRKTFGSFAQANTGVLLYPKQSSEVLMAHQC